jgi:hypothetical protein
MGDRRARAAYNIPNATKLERSVHVVSAEEQV